MMRTPSSGDGTFSTSLKSYVRRRDSGKSISRSKDVTEWSLIILVK